MAARSFTVPDAHIHVHLRKRMEQRGVTWEEVQHTLQEGWPATDAKPGTSGKRKVFPYEAEWQGQFYEEKEVTVYYKVTGNEDLILLTVLARYGQDFPRRLTR